MEMYLKSFNGIAWQSDWNGYEVGYEDIEVVGLYGIPETDILFYVDVSTGKVLEFMTMGE